MTSAHLLAAHKDPSKIIRTSGRTRQENETCVINQALMGRVLDREGRRNEIESPLSKMPPLKKKPVGNESNGWGVVVVVVEEVVGGHCVAAGGVEEGG